VDARKLCAGIDIGGTKMAVALVDQQARIAARTSLATEAGMGFDRAVERLISAIEQLLAEVGSEAAGLGGIGIGCAGPVDPLRGQINNPYTLEGWNRCNIVDPLRLRFGVPAVLENDADAAAVGESLAGAGKGAESMVLLTFGTGVGGGVVLSGRIYRGAEGEHPELGHLVVDSGGPPCYCGVRGCLESMASGTALGEAGRAQGYGSAPEVFEAATGDEARAVAIVERAVEAASRAAWTICHTFLPQTLVLGGGIMEQWFDRFAGPIRERLRHATQFTPANVAVVKAQLGNDAGMVGAGLLAWGGRR